MNIPLLLITGMLLCCTTLALAVERPAYPCSKLATPPTIDGKLDDPAWNTLPKATGFLIPGMHRPVIQRQTEFRAGYDAANFYLAIRCVEPEAGKPKANCGGVEVFMTTQMENPGVYYQFGINADGTSFGPTRFTKHMGLGTPLTDPGYQFATRIEDGAWCAEVRIPLSLFKETREPGKAWLFNISRYAPAGMADGEAFSTWSFLPKIHWHMFIYYNPFRFLDETLSPAQVTAAEGTLNAGYQSWLKDKLPAYQAIRALQVQTAGKTNLAVNPPNTPPAAQVKDNVYGNLVTGKGVHLLRGKPGLFELTWPKAVTCDTVLLDWGNAATLVRAYSLEYWDGQDWKLLADVTGNEWLVSAHTFAPVTVTKLRIRTFDPLNEMDTLKNLGVYLLGEKGEGQ